MSFRFIVLPSGLCEKRPERPEFQQLINREFFKHKHNFVVTDCGRQEQGVQHAWAPRCLLHGLISKMVDLEVVNGKRDERHVNYPCLGRGSRTT
jgi:hypothetical protein